jgi:ubiquinone/menaquinone biosynthesis C-methylase UbiE
MSWETRSLNAFASSQLPVAPGDAVLEVGCGHGHTLVQLARRARDGFVAGIDPSDVMVRLSTRRLRDAIEGGRAEVHSAEAARLPFDDGLFDAALAVHVLYFWAEPQVELREIRRVLRPSGTLVLGFRPDGPEARAQLPDSVYHMRSVGEVEKLLRETGFEVDRVATHESPFVCVVARAVDGIAPAG